MLTSCKKIRVRLNVIIFYFSFMHISSHTPSFFFTEVWCPTKGEDCIIQSFYWCSYTLCNTHPTNLVSGFDWFPWCKVRCGHSTMFFCTFTFLLREEILCPWEFKHRWFILLLQNVMVTSYTAFLRPHLMIIIRHQQEIQFFLILLANWSTAPFSPYQSADTSHWSVLSIWG